MASYSERFVTRRVRFSYPYIFQPDKNGKYSVSILIPKDDEETCRKLKEACKAVYTEAKNGALKGLLYEEVAKPYHDGDGRKPKGGAYGDECKGHWVLNAKSKLPPTVVERDPKNICTDEEHLYPGCYGRASLSVFAYNNNGNRGIGCRINGLQTYAYGDRLGGSFDAECFNDGYVSPDENTDEDML